MGMLDTFTGGKSGDASDAIKKAMGAFEGVDVPSTQELTLPQLQAYVQAGIMTPAQAESFMQQSNAYEKENTPQTGNDAMIQALNQLSDVSDAGPNGTPMEQAQVAQAQDQMNQTVAGQRGAIEQQMEAKGTPAAMIQAVLQNQYVGQDASQAHKDALQAQAQAYQQAVQALSEKAGVGATLQGQQNAQANTVANAANAMQQFNAQNQQAASSQNAGLTQQANLVNAENAQNTSNANTELNNSRTAYNAKIPQTQFADKMQKASGVAGAAEKAADVATGQGQQTAGLYSGLIGAGANLAGDYMNSKALSKAFPGQTPAAAPGYIDPASAGSFAKGGVVPHEGCYHEGGICMDSGGMVPGQPEVQGDSLQNDKVPVMASPGEAVIPRSAVQKHMPEVLSLISEARGNDPAAAPHHPQDVATLLQALRAIRTGAA